MYILGISAFYHDSAAAITQSGNILSACQEERFTRIKHDASFPKNAIQACIKNSGIDPEKIDHVVFYDKPFLKFERLLETYITFAPRGFQSFAKAIPLWVKEKILQKNLLIKELSSILPNVKWEKKILFSEHHLSHAASAYYPSPFDQAVVLTMDGVGEWATTSLSVGKGNNLKILREIHFPDSLGLLYSAFTYYTGFRVNSGEYKLMGLAPFGSPKYKDKIFKNLIDVKEDGTFKLNQKYFNYATGLSMINNKFINLFGRPPRKPDETIDQFYMDIAASIQAALEEIILKLTRSLAVEFKINNLCLAGGVALNCVANGKIAKDGAFNNVWVQPAAGDAGAAIGAALAVTYLKNNNERKVLKHQDAMKGSYLGPEFNQNEIEKTLSSIGANFTTLEEKQLIDQTAKILTTGSAVGWFQGKMEFGPRALGNRSILCDPRSTETQAKLNRKIKYREDFRPFAPAILFEDLKNWFDLHGLSSPYMSLIGYIKKERMKEEHNQDHGVTGFDKLKVINSTIPAVTHVDGSSRIQTVHQETNPLFHQLLSAFKNKTGCPVLVNTSFNVRGEPIVCNPKEAFLCFMATKMEWLVIGNCLLEKEKQSVGLRSDHHTKFSPD